MELLHVLDCLGHVVEASLVFVVLKTKLAWLHHVNHEALELHVRAFGVDFFVKPRYFAALKFQHNKINHSFFDYPFKLLKQCYLILFNPFPVKSFPRIFMNAEIFALAVRHVSFRFHYSSGQEGLATPGWSSNYNQHTGK